jgi:hypothetical protein
MYYIEHRLGVRVNHVFDPKSTNFLIHSKANFSVTDGNWLQEKYQIKKDDAQILIREVLSFLASEKLPEAWPDIFGFMFWSLARVEEYDTYHGDKHGRFASKDSLWHEFDVIQRPLVDEVIFKLANALTIKLPTVKHLSSLDIDQAYAYAFKKEKVFLGFLYDLFRGRFENLKWRYESFISSYDDPYFSYEFIYDKHLALKLKPIVFVLVSENKHPYDNNLDPHDAPYRVVINMLANQYQMGIHPSYQSSLNLELVCREKNVLEKIIEKPITASRQHYLRLSLPNSYRELITCGITDDYSMAFADTVGYRAGTGQPFLWYDLEHEQCTNLWIHPFQIMDVTLKDYMQYSPEKALDIFHRMVEHAEQVGSSITILWHNSSLHSLNGWKLWKDIYSHMLTRMAQYNNSHA